MPLKDWPPTEDWPPKETLRTSHEELAKLDQVDKRPEQSWSQVTEAQASIETFKRELAALEEFRNQLRESSREIEGMKQSVEQAAALRTELEQIRGVAGQLGDDYARMRDASREARERSAAAAEVVQDVERKLGWLGQHVNDIHTKLDAATRRRDEFVQETARMEEDGRALAAAISTHVERFALEKRQFEAFEQRMEALMERERQLAYLPQRLEEFSRIFEELTHQTDELRSRQASLEPLHEQLRQVDDLSGRVHAQFESLQQSRGDLEPLSRFTEMAATLETQLTRADERLQSVDMLERRLTALQATASDVDEKFTALLARQAELAQKADEVDQKMKRLADRDAGVMAMKEELDNVHQMSARSKADLQYISDHREDLALLRSRLEELLTLTGAVEQKIRRIF